MKPAALGPLPLLGAALVLLAAVSPAAGAQTDTPSTAELEALYWERQRAAREHFTDADVRFMTMMIGHHAQALVMTGMAERNGAGPSVRRLAARIENAQRDEIATMQRWLRDRGQPAPEVRVDGTRLWIRGGLDVHAGHDTGGHETDEHAAHDAGGHADHGMDGPMESGARPGERDGTALHAGMDGILTQAQLDEMDAARGAAFDRLFLAYMIEHHAGAVTMVEDLFATDGAGQDEASFRLASDIQVDQRTEIARMRLLLDDLLDAESGE